jgi:hypothetical protein
MKRGLILPALALTVAATPHKLVRNSSALDFKYEWPAEAAAIPALDLRFYTDAKHELAEAWNGAPEDKREYEQEGRGSVRDLSLTKWTTAGQSSTLLSLRGDYEVYTGGAHPNYDIMELLWDRQRGRKIKFGDLFTTRDGFVPILRPSYCRKLAKEHVKRTGDPIEKEFWRCTNLSDVAIIPTDGDKNGRFDKIDFVAAPYVAGSFAEGEYDIPLPVTPRLIAALKPQYRDSFEPQRQ